MLIRSNGSPETVVKHSCRLCLITMVLSETIEGINKDKCLKMAVIHDLPEILDGDAYRLGLSKQVDRHAQERAALNKLVEPLRKDTAAEITGLWLEFEEGITQEARLVRLIDRLEVLIQRNESWISKWSDLDKQIQYGPATMQSEHWGFLGNSLCK
jgi:putative hydrolases of HD superfamily